MSSSSSSGSASPDLRFAGGAGARVRRRLRFFGAEDAHTLGGHAGPAFVVVQIAHVFLSLRVPG